MLSKTKLMYLFCFSIALLGCFFLFSHVVPPRAGTASSSTPAFKQISEVFHASDADYIFLQESMGSEWIYKQITNLSPEDQIVGILEVVASKVARTANIPINEVRMISGSDPFEHRLFDQYPGTLHLKVPGKSVENCPPWEGFDIHQKIRSPFTIARLGSLAPEEIGLRREIIQNMAKHPDLAKIAALDTFLGNNDRSNPNLFYDKEGDAFYGIDMGNCWMGNLAQSAHERLKECFVQKFSFSPEERLGLDRYRQVLRSLISLFPPAKTFALLEHTLEEAGFVPSNLLLWDEGAERRVRKWKLAIEENYQSCVELADFLELIDKDNIK